MGGKHEGENREGEGNTNPLAGNERYFIPRAAFV